ncbi:lysine histidine transporter 1-like isoform X2 [Salvia hispanica]|uniref:lysine histidine transporter 1-like isoform X2 n=1 Tax=Salvia hispanica TaxID=49212 RepID=UPI0020092DC1|nr:lysine histidine transporter 1-like isoform X2 [Salvia hispanica]
MEIEFPGYDWKKYNNDNVDERSAEERAIDDWLPITASRKARWWFSTLHIITAVVGAGVLSLPYAMSELGWGAGAAALVISWMITLYTLLIMVHMHEMVPGERFDRYHELGQRAFGDKLGLWIVLPQQLVCLVGVNIVYMITGGQSLKKFHDLVCKDCKHIKLTYFIMIVSSAHFVLSQLSSFNSISGVSLAAAVMSISYSTVAWGASLGKGVQPNVHYGLRSKTTAGAVFDFFSALGTVAFANSCHNVVMEIQASLPSTPDRPSEKPMWKGAIVAYVIVALCYFPVALIGYWTYGVTVDENILITLQRPKWLVAMANMFVAVHLIGGYQLYAMPIYDMTEIVLVKKLKFKQTWYLSFNDVYCHYIPVLWLACRVLWRLCIRAKLVHPSLHHVACHLPTKEIQLILVGELGVHIGGGSFDGCCTHWRAKADYFPSQNISIL